MQIVLLKAGSPRYPIIESFVALYSSAQIDIMDVHHESNNYKEKDVILRYGIARFGSYLTKSSILAMMGE
jgi:hypothetical protein